MSKIEEQLKAAIEAKDSEAALLAFEKFQTLTGVTDEQSAEYFEQIEAIDADENEENEEEEENENIEINLSTMNLEELQDLMRANGLVPHALSKEAGCIKALLKFNPDFKNEIEEENEEEENEEEIPVETRGRKAKDSDRKELEDDLSALISKTLAFNAKISKKGNADSKFARRLAKRLVVIRKQLVR